MTKIGIIARIITYLLNAAALYILVMMAFVVTNLVYRYPDCEVVSIRISENIGELLLRYVPALILMTGLNFLIERKAERRINSAEYLWLLYGSAFILVIAVIYTSYDFYTHCRK